MHGEIVTSRRVELRTNSFGIQSLYSGSDSNATSKWKGRLGANGTTQSLGSA